MNVIEISLPLIPTSTPFRKQLLVSLLAVRTFLTCTCNAPQQEFVVVPTVSMILVVVVREKNNNNCLGFFLLLAASFSASSCSNQPYQHVTKNIIYMLSIVQ